VQYFTFEYDPEENHWAYRQRMPVKRDQAPAVALGTQIHVLGGSVNCHCQAIGGHDGYNPPDLQIDKEIDSPGGVCPGQQVTYTITITYTGPVAVSATVTDTVPQGLTLGGG